MIKYNSGDLPPEIEKELAERISLVLDDFIGKSIDKIDKTTLTRIFECIHHELNKRFRPEIPSNSSSVTSCKRGRSPRLDYRVDLFWEK